MKFHESGLPNNKIIEEAFNYSYANVMSYRGEAMKDFTQQVSAGYQQHIAVLDMEKNNNAISEADYKREKEAVERWRDDQIKVGPKLVEQGLSHMFQQRRLAPALELHLHSEGASPELIAAILLCESVRSPIDYQRVTQKFGEGIAGIVAEWNHIDAYPSERDKALSAAGRDTKRAYMAFISVSLGQIVTQIRQGMQAIIPPGYEVGLFNNAKILWGNDKKLDQRFFDTFNEVAETISSPFRLELGTDGGLELTKGNLTPPKNPGIPPLTPGKKTGIGDSDF